MEEEIKKSNRGGKREGSGRKRKEEVATGHLSARIRIDWLEIIAGNYPDRTQFLKEAIKEKLEREGLI